MEKKAKRKRASREEMIERLKQQNVRHEMAIAKNIEKIKKLEASATAAELVTKINESGLTIADVMKMIDEKNN